MTLPPLVLASASPRRKELLERIGLTFEVLPSDVDEFFHGGSPEAFAREASARKAEVASRRRPGAAVVAADTIVVLRDEDSGTDRVLGKPEGPDEARRMLAELSDRKTPCHQRGHGPVGRSGADSVPRDAGLVSRLVPG